MFTSIDSMHLLIGNYNSEVLNREKEKGIKICLCKNENKKDIVHEER